ncbi:hypothetical protein SUGI_0083110 [Cryptomeria japonica]|nr:hypothetical protein SUGI_0083110 [Cryptomeria japonica]
MEVVRICNPVPNLLGLGWIFICCISFAIVDGDAAPYAPAMFIFGDSLADFGTSNFILESKVRANISDFPKQTGRFSDGRLTFDYIGMY